MAKTNKARRGFEITSGIVHFIYLPAILIMGYLMQVLIWTLAVGLTGGFTGDMGNYNWTSWYIVVGFIFANFLTIGILLCRTKPKRKNFLLIIELSLFVACMCYFIISGAKGWIYVPIYFSPIIILDVVTLFIKQPKVQDSQTPTNNINQAENINDIAKSS